MDCPSSSLKVLEESAARITSSRSPGVMISVPGLKYSIAWPELIAPMTTFCTRRRDFDFPFRKCPFVVLQIWPSVAFARIGS